MAALIWLYPVGIGVRLRVVAVSAAVLVLLQLVARFRLETLRDWLPPALVWLAYREAGWFARPFDGHPLEQQWIRLDRVVLGDWGLKALTESLGPAFPSILEIAYVLVSPIPVFGILALIAFDYRERIDRFLFAFTLGTTMAYALFPFFPSEPPRVVFAGEYAAMDTIFRQFSWWILDGNGIHSSVFPSAHVSGSLSAALAMRRVLPEKPWVGGSLMALAALIFWATIYGRYHYVVDALAGVGVAVAAYVFSLRQSVLFRRTG